MAQQRDHMNVPFLCTIAVVVTAIGASMLWGGASNTAAVGMIDGNSNDYNSYSRVPLATSTTATTALQHTYIEIVDSCGPYYDGDCVNARSGPGTNYPAVAKLRTGMVFEVSDKVTASDGSEWYKVIFNEWLRYPDRIATDWYVAGNLVRAFTDPGDASMQDAHMMNTSGKLIIVDKAAETLTAYDGDEIFMQTNISVGLDGTPTPLGTFNIYRKTPSRYMQGPIPGLSDQEYDLPGVPWTMYFTPDGGAIHGAYWHDHFGEPWSHGCVNLAPADAQKLYEWADIGTPVVVD